VGTGVLIGLGIVIVPIIMAVQRSGEGFSVLSFAGPARCSHFGDSRNAQRAVNHRCWLD
jgi:hypothetical protein